MSPTPDRAAFLMGPIEQVAAVAPATVLYTQGGTRRRAVLDGVAAHSEEYVRISWLQMIESAALWFRLGVRHLWMTAIAPEQMAERGRYRDRLLDWVDQGLAGPAALDEWRRRGWRVRLAGAQTLPELQPTADRLAAEATPDGAPTLWWFVNGQQGGSWAMTEDAIRRAEGPGEAAARRALYGEELPPAALYLSFGKPMMAFDVIPPLLLAADVQCYWSQRPGYILDEQLLRSVIYDYAFLRRTWTADKEARYATLMDHSLTWERPLVLGLGRRLGTFWYPADGEEQERAVGE